ncbi:MAG: hypothetical protein AAF602_20560 [Myxococcota bacterium]
MVRRLGFLFALVPACGPGVCEGTGGEIDVCYEGWTPEECDSFDRTAEFDADWTHSFSGTCGDRGYTLQCRDTFLLADAVCTLQ